MVRTLPDHLHYHNPSDPTCTRAGGVCLMFSAVDAVGATSRTPWQLFWVSSASAAGNSLNLWPSAKNYAWLAIHLMQGCWEIRPSYSPGVSDDWCRVHWRPDPCVKVGPLCGATWTSALSGDQVRGGLSGTKSLLCFPPFLILFSIFFLDSSPFKSHGPEHSSQALPLSSSTWKSSWTSGTNATLYKIFSAAIKRLGDSYRQYYPFFASVLLWSTFLTCPFCCLFLEFSSSLHPLWISSPVKP